jgi:hypothetical protein
MVAEGKCWTVLSSEIRLLIQSYRTNNFFNQANEEFFKPRGLYCLVMTWYPEDPDTPAMSMDLQSTIAKATFGADSTVLGSSLLGNLERKFKRSDGKTFGNVFPEVAPLVFPEPETLGNRLDPAERFYKVKKKRDFIHGYLDKRAQATFVGTLRYLRVVIFLTIS